MKTPDPLPRPDYEPEDVSPRVIAATAGVLAGIVGVCLLAGALIDRPEPAPIPAAPDGLFQHGPEARTSIEETWAQIDRSARDQADGYGWVDRKAGIVRIPLRRAIELVCAEQKSAAAGKTEPSVP